MVKTMCFSAVLFMSFNSLDQNLSLGVGGRVNANWVEYRDAFNFDILTNSGDTLIMQTSDEGGVNLTNGLSFPIYARYTSKRNWWAQLNYGYEVWRFGINAFSTPSNYRIQSAVNARIEALTGNYSAEEIEELRQVYTEDAIDEGTVALSGFERVQYNKLSLAVGSSINKKGIVTFYYGAGFDFFTTSTIESYQGLVYDNEEVSLLHEVLSSMPKLESTILSPFISLGIEKQNIRLGLDFAFHSGPTFGQHQDRLSTTTIVNSNKSQLVKNIKSVGVSLNYTLFNQNFNQAISADKKNVLDPVVIGKYRQKPKLVQYGLSLNFPNFRNVGWSVIDDFELENEDDIVLYNDSLNNKGDTYLTGRLFKQDPTQNYGEILDYIYLEKEDMTIFINDDGDIDTNFLSTLIFLDWGNINSIVKTPKLSAFIRVNPHELFSAEFNMGYQNHTYGIVAYETETERIGSKTNIQTRKLVYQENFHELSFGMNAYTQMEVNNISRLGIHIGLNYNAWFKGAFQQEPGGINDSELLEDFHDYNVGDGEEDEEWNKNLNAEADKGIFTKEDYYNYQYNNQNQTKSYHTDFSNYLFNSLQKRNYFELRLGIDYYIENLKFNIYAERSLLRNNTMYSSLFTAGMGVSLFLN